MIGSLREPEYQICVHRFDPYYNIDLYNYHVYSIYKKVKRNNKQCNGSLKRFRILCVFF